MKCKFSLGQKSNQLRCRPFTFFVLICYRVERLYLNGDIQVLVATATLAWGVNLPARLVIVKGTEYFDGKTSRYVDYPLTDVLQMIGRAGRPGFDTEGRAVVLVETSKKNFYMVRGYYDAVVQPLSGS